MDSTNLVAYHHFLGHRELIRSKHNFNRFLVESLATTQSSEAGTRYGDVGVQLWNAALEILPLLG
jgi:hypothetical protein